MKKNISLLLTSIILINVISCNIMTKTGTESTDTTDGQDNMSVYLEDTNGNRYYSGSTIYIGTANSSNPTISTDLAFKTEGTREITLNGSGDKVQFGNYEYFNILNDNNDEYRFESNTNGNGPVYGDLLSSNYITKNETGDQSYSFTITQLPDNIMGINWIISFHKQYIIPCTIDGKTFNFVFDVYGSFDTFGGTIGI